MCAHPSRQRINVPVVFFFESRLPGRVEGEVGFFGGFWMLSAEPSAA